VRCIGTAFTRTVAALQADDASAHRDDLDFDADD
jgi:hypothetical protein